MATSPIEIWNLAIASVGSSQTVSHENEDSPQANVCRLFYEEVRRFINAQAPWGFALSWARLAVKAERVDGEAWNEDAPAPGWRFAYSLPSEMASPFHLQSYAKFEMGLHKGVPTLMTDEEDAVLRYVVDQENPTYWTPEFTQAVYSLLAFRIAPRINAKMRARDRLREEAFEFILAARTDAANTQQSYEVDALPPSIAARGFGGIGSDTQYFFPLSQLNGVTL